MEMRRNLRAIWLNTFRLLLQSFPSSPRFGEHVSLQAKKQELNRQANSIRDEGHINSITYFGVEELDILGWLSRNNEVLFTRGFVVGLLRSFEVGGRESLVGVDSFISWLCILEIGVFISDCCAPMSIQRGSPQCQLLIKQFLC